MKYAKSYLVLITLLFFYSQKIFAQAGTPDLSFGDSGILIVKVISYGDQSLIQSDGKILVLCASNGLYRFKPDGSFDSSFGINGKAIIDTHQKLYSQNNDFALQADGKIVCTGEYYAKNGNILSGVYRVNPDGTMDTGFGYDGIDSVKTDNLNYTTGIVIQPDGKIVVSGDSRKSVYDDSRTFIYRLMPDGGLDPTFGENGIVINNHAESIHSVGLLLKPDGKLVIGSTYDVYGGHTSYELESFNPDGSVDETFGDNGKAEFSFEVSKMNALVLGNDGKITCVGAGGDTLVGMALCRFNENGTVDEGFGNKGGVYTPYLNQNGSEFFDVTLESDDKILACGFSLVNSPTSRPSILARYLENGDLDFSFGENGLTSTIDPPNHLGGTGVHVLADGKILVTGGFSGNVGPFIFLGRYNGDNVLASNFKEVKAIQENDNITITWQTLNENNTKSYTVERSNNAKDYAGINTIPAKHAATNSYSYTDKNPLYGDNYFRIKENAANGSFTYSQTLKVVFENGSNIFLYPNPAKNTVTIKGLDKNAAAVIKITDMNGREISKFNFSNTSSTTLSIRTLAQGSYFILVEQNGKVTKLRLIKE